jgi:hypothetical protein
MGGIIRVIRPGGGCTDFFVCVTIRRFSSRAQGCLLSAGMGCCTRLFETGKQSGSDEGCAKGPNVRARQFPTRLRRLTTYLEYLRRSD